MKPDRELLYLAAMFHDSGLLTPSPTSSSASRSTAPTTRANSSSTGASRRPPPRPSGWRSRCTPLRASPTGWPRRSRPPISAY
ncbi:hypothetical protein [Plantactinospora veratri]